MEGVYLERKCHYMGFWKDDTVADNVIRQMASMVRNGKGTKCKILLTSDGLKVTTSSHLGGKHIKDIASFENIYFVTVNQYHPQCVLFITKDERRKYRVVAIRCANTMDANLFVSCFKDLKHASKSVGLGKDLELRQVKSGNWTLRAKHPIDEKRQLKTLVDMKTANSIKHRNTDINSNVDIVVTDVQNENNNIAQTNGSFKHDINIDDVHATSLAGKPDVVIETELGDELDNLSQELREIKLIIESSTGVVENETKEQNKKDLDFIQNDNTHDVEVMESNNNVEKSNGPIPAIVIIGGSSDEEANGPYETIQNGHLNESKSTTSTNSDDGEIKVAVRDYRKSDMQKSSTYTRKYIPKDNNTTTGINKTNGDPSSPRPSSTSYDSWKDDVVLRAHTTRPARSTYVSTYNPRSSLPGSVRSRDSRFVYDANSKTHHTLSHYPVRVPTRRSINLSSTVERPIEKVYPRPRSAHGSIVYRPNQRGNVYSVPTKRVYVDKYQGGSRKSEKHQDDYVIFRT